MCARRVGHHQWPSFFFHLTSLCPFSERCTHKRWQNISCRATAILADSVNNKVEQPKQLVLNCTGRSISPFYQNEFWNCSVYSSMSFVASILTRFKHFKMLADNYSQEVQRSIFILEDAHFLDLVFSDLAAAGSSTDIMLVGLYSTLDGQGTPSSNRQFDVNLSDKRKMLTGFSSGKGWCWRRWRPRTTAGLNLPSSGLLPWQQQRQSQASFYSVIVSLFKPQRISFQSIS